MALRFGELLVLEGNVCVRRCLSKSFFFPHFVFTAGHADVPGSRSFGFRSLRAHAEDLRVFLLLSVLCVLSICTCGALPRWWLVPLCVCASSTALLAISRNAVSYLLGVVFCEGSASSHSVLAAHFLGGG